MKFFFILICIMYSSLYSLYARYVYLHDGTKLTITSYIEHNDNYIFQTPYGEIKTAKDEVDGVFHNDFDRKQFHYTKKTPKRHFFELTGSAGYFFDASFYSTIHMGGLIGLSFGYQFLVCDYFAFGPVVSGFVTFGYEEYYMDYYDDDEDGDREFIQRFDTCYTSGGGLFLQCMVGDITNKKIAFIGEVGGGWMFGSKIGLYIKGFVIKIGYHQTWLGSNHNFILDVGYKFNFKGKVRKAL